MVSYRPVLDRQRRPLGYRLLVQDVANVGSTDFAADRLSLAMASQLTPAVDDAASSSSSSTSTSTSAAPAGAAGSSGSNASGNASVDYWLPATETLLERLPPAATLRSPVVWLLPIESLNSEKSRTLCERLLETGHRFAAVGPSSAFAQANAVSVELLRRFTSLHVVRDVVAAVAPAVVPSAGPGTDALYTFKRSGCRLIRVPGAGASSDAEVAAPFDAAEGFFAPLKAVTSKAGKPAVPTYGFVLRALQLTQADAHPNQIEEALRVDPVLSFRLLRYANAAAIRGSQPIERLSQAIVRVGYRQFGRWLALGLVTSQVDRGGSSALVDNAVVRALMLESIAARHPDAMVRDQAFITGLFSLLDTIVGVPLSDLVGSASLSEDVRAALLRGEGELGRLLGLARLAEWRGQNEDRPQVAADLDPTSRGLLEALLRAPTLL